MNRVVASLAGLFLVVGFLCAQDGIKDSGNTKKFFYRSAVNMDELYAIDKSMLSDHPFGELTARKLYVLQKIYTYVEPPSPTSPGEKTIVKKPVIYNTILKLNRNLKKMVKKGTMDKNKATSDLNLCLDVALSISADDTGDFESELKKAKSPDSIVQVFQMVELR
jgi:hypothetical protein